jgi:hypothetical protein
MMLDISMLAQLACRNSMGGSSIVPLEEVFDRVVAAGWEPQNPAGEAALGMDGAVARLQALDAQIMALRAELA